MNNQIRSPELRVIDSKGKQVGVLKLQKAMELAQKASLDLIEIAPNATPPVAKVADFGKFKYAEEKKLRAEKKKTKAVELKEVRFTPFIGEGDYKTRQARVREFLTEGRKVRIAVVFKGRQMKSRKFGYSLLKKIYGDYGEGIRVEMDPKFVGRHLISIIAPVKAQINNAKTENTKISSK